VRNPQPLCCGEIQSLAPLTAVRARPAATMLRPFLQILGDVHQVIAAGIIPRQTFRQSKAGFGPLLKVLRVHMRVASAAAISVGESKFVMSGFRRSTLNFWSSPG